MGISRLEKSQLTMVVISGTQEGCLCARTVVVLAVFVVVFLGWLRPRVTKLPDVWSGAGFVPLLCTEADSYRLMIDAGWAPH
jgi:hypothetical protein